MKNKEYINQEILNNYSSEDSIELSSRLGITLEYLRVKARRLGVSRGSRTITNEIVEGKKLCPNCGEIKETKFFNKDCYQPNGLDYWCRKCRRKGKKINKETETNNSLNGAKKSNSKNNTSTGFGIKKTRNPVIRVPDGNGKIVDGLRCKGTYCGNAEKPLSEFHKDKNNPSGHKNICKFCISQQRKKK